MKKILFCAVAGLAAVMTSVSGQDGRGEMLLKSPAFEHNQYIPAEFTCQGRDVNPELNIYNIPKATKSLVLIMDDPDAPAGTWVHWLVYDVAVMESIAEDSVPGKQGKNSWDRINYGGPCPPSGTHRYFFKLYALDCLLSLPAGADKKTLEKAMQGHILDQTELIGLYQKK